MKTKMALSGLFLILLFSVPTSISALLAQSGLQPNERADPDASPQTPKIMMPASGAQETLRLFEGKSLVVNSPEALKRVSVTNDQIATAIVLSPNQILIHGIKPGNISLMLWNEQEQVQSFELQVLTGPMDLEPLRATLRRVLPGENIQVNQSGASVVLTGTVSSASVVDQAVAVAKTETPNVVSLLGTAKMSQVVLLQVKFAEVQRGAVRQLGLNLFSTGALNTPGTISTQQFSAPSTADVNGIIGGSLSGTTTTMALADMLNIFVFRPDLNLGLTIKAMQQQNLLQILAEPNLLALGGKEASFLAGGEFPVPIVTAASGGSPAVSVQFKEFGVRLKFTADPNPDGTIHLKVSPEVSSLDYANAVTLSGFLIPAMQTRRADTEVQLKDGQSFAIAGLLDNRLTKLNNKIPWLGDVPFLGKLFRSSEFKKSNSELLVMVTPKLVKPIEAGQLPPLPEFSEPFLDSQKFDGKAGETAVPGGSKLR
jgi:pilus assembly protein CpaC